MFPISELFHVAWIFLETVHIGYSLPWDMKGWIHHFVKWWIHPFVSALSKVTMYGPENGPFKNQSNFLEC